MAKIGSVKKAKAAPPAPVDPTTTWLLPRSWLWLRIALFVAIAGFGLATGARTPSKVIWVLSAAFLLGSFRVAKIRGGQFERRMIFMFIPLKLKRWPMERFVDIETRFGDPGAMGAQLVFSIFNIFFVLWAWLFDRLIPWLGGNFQLRLKLVKGGRVLVWQGNSEATFQKNLATLEAVTKLRVRRV